MAQLLLAQILEVEVVLAVGVQLLTVLAPQVIQVILVVVVTQLAVGSLTSV